MVTILDDDDFDCIFPDVSHLKDLVAVVAEENLPRDDLLQKIKDKITNAESCMESSRELMNKKVNSR